MAWSGWEMNFLLMEAAVGSPKKPLSDRGEAAAGSGFSRAAGCGSGEPRQGLCPSAGFTGGERGQPSTVSSSSRVLEPDTAPQLGWRGCGSVWTPCMRKMFHPQPIIGTLHTHTLPSAYKWIHWRVFYYRSNCSVF